MRDACDSSLSIRTSYMSADTIRSPSITHRGGRPASIGTAPAPPCRPAQKMDAPSSIADFRRAADHLPGMLCTVQADGDAGFLNRAWGDYTGLAPASALARGWQAAIHPADLPTLLAFCRALPDADPAARAVARLRRADGAFRWCAFSAAPLHDGDGTAPAAWCLEAVDVDDLPQAPSGLAGEARMLERIATGGPLAPTLADGCRLLEQEAGGDAVVAVLLLDEGASRLSLAAAPALQPALAERLDGLPAEPSSSPCAAAAVLRETLSIADIARDPRWPGFAETASRLGAGAALLSPIVAGDGGALGVVALFLRSPCEPAPAQRRLAARLAHLAAVAVGRERQDLARRESEARLNGLAQTTPDVLWIVDLNPQRLRYASPGCEALWGRSLSALERGGSRAWLQTLHPEDRPRVESAVQRWITAGAPPRHDLKFRIVRPDGSVRWIHGRGMREDDATGQPRRASGICTDITEWASAEAALRSSEERFALAVAGSNDGLWDWDICTNEMFLSERAQRLYGLEPGVTVRQRSEWRSMVRIHPDDVERQLRLVDDYLAGGPTYDGEWRVRHADGGYRWVRVRGLCVRDRHGRPTRMAGSVSDVDPFRRAEAALLQAQRLEAAGTLAEGIAHDFNNILSAILGYGEMAMRDARPGTRLRRDLDSIHVAAERGRSLVDRLLAFSRSNVAERTPVHVEAVVSEAIALLKATLPPQVRIAPRLQARRAATLGDSTLLHQVFMNLATNAIQAMPAGGTLGITLEERDQDAECVATTGVLPAGRYVVLKVADTGIGIPPAIANRIFDPFFTTKEPGVGTGLGLSLVHGLVSSLGGAVEVTSRVGEGTVFTVYLPHAGDAPPERSTEDPALPRGHGERVLVVDDEAALVTLLSDALVDLGYAVHGCPSGVAAREALRAAPDAFDVMVTDERMPGLSGIELARQARALRPAMPIVLVSGFLGGRIAAQAREAGITEVLKKPLSTRELAVVLARLLGPPAP